MAPRSYFTDEEESAVTVKRKRSSAVEIGKSYFFRTVTFHLVGRAVAQRGSFVELADASWVADSGRFMQAIQKGELQEVEPVGEAHVNLDTVTDFYPWRHPLPTKQK